ncbi:MAG: hypothetical protein Ct9H300mP28_18720 [Pseudomonadota bacterium]|nr:MAG: hypothetical protein Ct9H300mP28_18720 [Pseudomonadota bacterium]
MIKYVGISYLEVIKHAFLPAVISYIALGFHCSFGSNETDLKGFMPRKVTTVLQKLSHF